MSRLAADHGLRLDNLNDVMEVLSGDVRKCVFTPEDVAPEFFDLRTQLAGEAFQKFINYRFPVAFVVPANHPYGERVTELAREHATHPVVRFFESVDEALAW